MDAVYPLHPAAGDFDELRYSLRTLEANTRVERVHFFGGKPAWLKTDLHVTTRQRRNKWANARTNLRVALESDAVSDPFVLMNDDFFVLKPVDPLPMWHGGPITEWVNGVSARYTEYLKWSWDTYRLLRKLGHEDPLWWDLHTPILVSKEAMHDALILTDRHGGGLHPRTLMANLSGLQGERAPTHDVKGQAIPGHLYASSSNATWARGPLGRHIRATFRSPSRWEC